MPKIKALWVPADINVPWVLTDVDRTLAAFQELVGGPVEQVTFSRNVVGLFNEEGLNEDLPVNSRVAGYLEHWFHQDNQGLGYRGNVVFVNQKGENWTDVNIHPVTWFAEYAPNLNAKAAERIGP